MCYNLIITELFVFCRKKFWGGKNMTSKNDAIICKRENFILLCLLFRSAVLEYKKDKEASNGYT